MPHKTYKHFCTVSGYEFSTGQKICWRCGGVGEYEGWGLSMVEHWCLYVRKTGFAPMGPHRHLVDSLFYDHWEQCGECDGLGIKQSPDHEDEWVDCTACDGKRVAVGQARSMNGIA